MKKTTGVAIGLAAIGGIAFAASKLASRKSKMAIAEEMVRHWSPIILKELDLNNPENILDKIIVSPELQKDGMYGCIHHQQQKESFFSVRAHYVPDSATINIFAENINYLYLDKGVRVKNPGMFGKTYRRALLFTLAHELRHFWQLHTGEYHENSIIMNGKNLVPYSQQWIEIDANKFALHFINKHKKQI